MMEASIQPSNSTVHKGQTLKFSLLGARKVAKASVAGARRPAGAALAFQKGIGFIWGVYYIRGYIGIMENRMETTITGYIEVISGLYVGYRISELGCVGIRQFRDLGANRGFPGCRASGFSRGTPKR